MQSRKAIFAYFTSTQIQPLALQSSVGGGPRVVVSTAAFHARVRGSVPGLGGLKETKMFLPHPRVKVSIAGSLRDREVACSASDRQGSNFESCVWRTVSSQSSHPPQEVLLAQFSLYVHKGGLKPDSFHFICRAVWFWLGQIRRDSARSLFAYWTITLCVHQLVSRLPDYTRDHVLQQQIKPLPHTLPAIIWSPHCPAKANSSGC